MVMLRLCLLHRVVILMLLICLRHLRRCLILLLPLKTSFSSSLLIFVSVSITVFRNGLALWIILLSLIGLWVLSLKILRPLKMVKPMFSFIGGLLTAVLIVGVVCIVLLTYNNL